MRVLLVVIIGGSVLWGCGRHAAPESFEESGRREGHEIATPSATRSEESPDEEPESRLDRLRDLRVDTSFGPVRIHADHLRTLTRGARPQQQRFLYISSLKGTAELDGKRVTVHLGEKKHSRRGWDLGLREHEGGKWTRFDLAAESGSPASEVLSDMGRLARR